MKTNRKYGMLGNLVVALAGAFVFAGLASAQDVVGKFTLPFEARWGLATLPAGEYEFTMERAMSADIIEVFRGTKGVALIVSQNRSAVSTCRAALTIVRTRDGNAVRDLTLPEEGMALHFAPYKSRRGSAAAERQIAELVSIPIEGK